MIFELDPLILRIPVLWEEYTCAEYAVCEILKAERVLKVRLRMLIGALYPKLERVWWYKWSCTSSYMVVATMNL